MSDLSNPEETPVGMIDRIKNKSTVLYEEHKTACIVGVIAATNVATLLIARQMFPPTTVINNIVAPIIAPVFNNVVNNGGYMRKIVRCIETDELWPSMSKAAEAVGHTLQAMSQQIHGGTENLDGLHYVIEGLSAS